MIKEIKNLKTLALTLILSSTLCTISNAEEVQRTKKPPVDEGNDLKPKTDKTKDVTFADDEISEQTIKLSLEAEKKNIVIKFNKSTKVPLTCKIIRNEVEVLSITKEPKTPKVSTALVFTIANSNLHVDDEIVIKNRRNIKIRNIKIIK